jgi:hypothetical protein
MTVMTGNSEPAAGRVPFQGMVGHTSANAWAAYAHYTHFLGRPCRVYALPDPHRPGLPRKTKLDVAVWTPLGKGSTALLATAGVSDRAMSDGTFGELLLLVRPDPGEEETLFLARMLKRLARVAFDTGVPLAAGRRVVVSGVPGPLSHVAAFLLAPPLTMDASFHFIRHRSGRRVAVLWAIPLHGVEDAWCAVHGPGALYDAWAQHDVDLARLDRPAVPLPD